MAFRPGQTVYAAHPDEVEELTIANSAATLLAPRIGVSYSTALSVVREWYAGHRDNPQPWTRVFG